MNEEKISCAEKHAEFELRAAGLFDKDSDYGGAIAKAVMRLIKTHAKEHHSGASNALSVMLFSKLAQSKTLSPISDNPAEWMDIQDYQSPERPALWQNRRDPSVFSHDAGKTHYSVDEEGRPVHQSASLGDKKNGV